MPYGVQQVVVGAIGVQQVVLSFFLTPYGVQLVVMSELETANLMYTNSKKGSKSGSRC